MELLVEKWYEDVVEGRKVGLLDECGPLVGLEIDVCATETVVLLFKPVNVTLEDVVATARVSKNEEVVGDDVRNILIPPICDGVEFKS